MCFRKNKEITFYAIYDKREETGVFINVTETKTDALEFIHRRLRIEHDAHYSAWCKLRDYNVKDTKAWFEYYQNVIESDEKSNYIVKEIKYTPKSIASILRMFMTCTPLGCSFELPVEHTCYQNKVKEFEEILSMKEQLAKVKQENKVEENTHGK